eukprot:COSAG01_NODE_2883_length_6913_cov_14.005429_3_plen_85_part_00
MSSELSLSMQHADAHTHTRSSPIQEADLSLLRDLSGQWARFGRSALQTLNCFALKDLRLFITIHVHIMKVTSLLTTLDYIVTCC